MKKEIIQILRSTSECFDTYAEKSRQEAMLHLEPGSPVPAKGKLYTDAARDRIKEQAIAARQEAQEIINGEISKVQTSIAAAPSTDAINTLTALNLSKSKEIRDYEAIYKTYGSNPQVAKTLNALAKENDVKFYTEIPVYEKMDQLIGIRDTVLSWLDPIRVMNNGLSESQISFIEWSSGDDW